MTDTPKIWKDMTPEEKGALLLAQHEGKEIEFWNGVSWRLVFCGIPNWLDSHSYRIRHEPKVETVAQYWKAGKSDNFVPMHMRGSPAPEECEPTHRITFDLIDGKPDCDSVKMEEL